MNPLIQIVDSIQNQKEIKQEFKFPTFGKKRKNNRKSTKGRHTQKIVCIDDSFFPPKFYIKFIKHLR